LLAGQPFRLFKIRASFPGREIGGSAPKSAGFAEKSAQNLKISIVGSFGIADGIDYAGFISCSASSKLLADQFPILISTM
jgi:hypothetical protein